MQLAWMQAAAEMQDDDCQCEYEGTWEYRFQETTEDVDIAAALLDVASEGLAAVENASQMRADLYLMLIKDTFMYIKNMPADYHQQRREDDLELRVGNSLRQADVLMANSVLQADAKCAITELKVIQRCIQDAMILACSRFIDQSILRNTSIPPELYERFEASLSLTDLMDDGLWSRLGNAKRHVFGEWNWRLTNPNEIRRKRRLARRRKNPEACSSTDPSEVPGLL